MTSEKVTPSEDVEKGTKHLYAMKYSVVTILRKYLDNFEEKSVGSTGWLNLDHEFFLRKLFTLEPDLYKKTFENDIEGQDIETYKMFVLPFDTTKLNLSMCNESVTPKKEKK